jgi:hypothetical protein
MKKTIGFVVAILMSTFIYAQVGMGSFMGNNNGGGGTGGSGGGGTGVPIDGGLITVVIGAAGYAYRKMKKSEEFRN